MSTSAVTNYTVISPNGRVELNATRVERDDSSGRLNFYNGEQWVGGFLNVSDFYPTAAAANA